MHRAGPWQNTYHQHGPLEADVEIHVLRRRVQLQAELRVYRANKFNQDTARRMEDLENDLSMMEIERDNLKTKLDRAEQQLATEAGSVKVRRALEIAVTTAETAASLNDLLSSLRIEMHPTTTRPASCSARSPSSGGHVTGAARAPCTGQKHAG